MQSDLSSGSPHRRHSRSRWSTALLLCLMGPVWSCGTVPPPTQEDRLVGAWALDLNRFIDTSKYLAEAAAGGIAAHRAERLLATFHAQLPVLRETDVRLWLAPGGTFNGRMKHLRESHTMAGSWSLVEERLVLTTKVRDGVPYRDELVAAFTGSEIAVPLLRGGAAAVLIRADP